MRYLRYTTPAGIVVTRTTSRLSFKRGLKHLLRELDTHRGIYLSSGYEYPGALLALGCRRLCPPLEIIARGRDVEFRPLNARGEMLARMFQPSSTDHPHWESFGFEGDDARRPPEAAAGAVPRRGTQQAAVGLLDSARADRRVPQRRGQRASRWSARSATICCSSSIPSSRSCRAASRRICTSSSATTSTSWIARRSRSSATSTISRSTASHTRACRATAS